MKLKPLNDWAVIVPSGASGRTAGGLYIPDTAKEKPEEGVVEAIGPGAFEEEQKGKKKEEGKERKFVPTTVKPGDRVLYERWAGHTHTIGTEERVLVRERNILGFIERSVQPGALAAPAITSLAERPASLPPQKAEPRLSSTGLKEEKAKTKTGSGKAAAAPARKKAAVKTGKSGKKK